MRRGPKACVAETATGPTGVAIAAGPWVVGVVAVGVVDEEESLSERSITIHAMSPATRASATTIAMLVEVLRLVPLLLPSPTGAGCSLPVQCSNPSRWPFLSRSPRTRVCDVEVAQPTGFACTGWITLCTRADDDFTVPRRDPP